MPHLPSDQERAAITKARASMERTIYKRRITGDDGKLLQRPTDQADTSSTGAAQ